jgi:hypothetical protein
MFYRPYHWEFPMPWWLVGLMITPDMLCKAGKKTLGLLHEAREKAGDAGKTHRAAWEKRKRDNM